MVKLWFMLLLWAGGAAAQSVEGRIINTATGAGIAGITVEIAKDGDVAATTVTSDVTGGFTVQNLDPGAYTVRYRTEDYRLEGTTSRPRVRLGGGYPAQVFQVTSGGPAVRIEANFTPFARITGRVVDGRGNAVPGAQMMILRSGTILTFGTNSEGKFNWNKFLLPGSYELSAAPPSSLTPPDPEPDSDGVLVWGRTYYPGVASRPAATKIILHGGEVVNVELKLRAVSTHAIRGTLVNPDGTPARGIPVSLSDGLLGGPRINTKSKSDGAFEFSGVVDGDWQLGAKLDIEGVALRVVEWVEMRGREIDRVKLRLAAPFTIQGRVVREVPDGMPTLPLPRLTVALKAHSSAAMKEMAATLADLGGHPDGDGTFRIENVYAGAYEVVVPPTLSGSYFLDSILVNEVEVGAAESEFSGPASLTVMYKTNGGIVRGKVEQCSGGNVWLFPQTSAMRRPGFFQRVPCDASGGYVVNAVRPGEYYALALPSGDVLGFRGSVSEEVLFGQATKVTVRVGETSSVDLRLVTRSDY